MVVNNEFYLIKPNMKDQEAVTEMISKWKSFGGRMNPGLMRRFDGDYVAWLTYLDNCEKGIDIGEAAPQSFYLLKNSNGDIVGAIALRHYLNHTNILAGGHIAYGICPEFRGKGYGKVILQMALEKIKEMNINKVLLVCDTDNIGSQKVILNNHGVLENQTVDEEGIPINRYWIEV